MTFVDGPVTTPLAFLALFVGIPGAVYLLARIWPSAVLVDPVVAFASILIVLIIAALVLGVALT